MYVPDETRKCVAFVGFMDTRGEPHIAATAFFVYIPFEHRGSHHSFIYCVTARHVVEAIDAMGNLCSMFLRLNLKSGGTRDFPVATNEWQYHSDPVFDAAVLPFAFDQEICDHRAYPVGDFLTPEFAERDQVGIGADLFILGLFKLHVPESKNVPILRVGNIAAMPEEPVLSGRGQAMLYLVETRSIGGLSGSPVFTYKKPILGLDQSGQEKNIPIPTRNNLMGMIHGHFDERERGEKINMGIAMVTPIQIVAEILECSTFTRVRELQRIQLENDYTAKLQPSAE